MKSPSQVLVPCLLNFVSRIFSAQVSFNIIRSVEHLVVLSLSLFKVDKIEID